MNTASQCFNILKFIKLPHFPHIDAMIISYLNTKIVSMQSDLTDMLADRISGELSIQANVSARWADNKQHGQTGFSRSSLVNRIKDQLRPTAIFTR